MTNSLFLERKYRNLLHDRLDFPCHPARCTTSNIVSEEKIIETVFSKKEGVFCYST
jgi:hypothetical protein